jgi:hypothetical protein
VGGVYLSIEQFLPDGGPSNFTTEFDFDAVLAKQFLLLCDEQRSAIRERNESDAHRLNDAVEGWLGRGSCLCHDSSGHEHQQCHQAKVVQKWRAMFFT